MNTKWCFGFSLWLIIGCSTQHPDAAYLGSDVHAHLPVPREATSVAYLRKWFQGMVHWLDSNPPFASEADRRNARQAAVQALRYDQDL